MVDDNANGLVYKSIMSDQVGSARFVKVQRAKTKVNEPNSTKHAICIVSKIYI